MHGVVAFECVFVVSDNCIIEPGFLSSVARVDNVGFLLSSVESMRCSMRMLLYPSVKQFGHEVSYGIVACVDVGSNFAYQRV